MGKRLANHPGESPGRFPGRKFPEHEIEKQQIGVASFQRGQASAAVMSSTDLKAFVREICSGPVQQYRGRSSIIRMRFHAV